MRPARARLCSPRCARREPSEHLRLTVGIANAEWWIGRTADARRRLQVALGSLPAQPSPDRIRLRLALALTALMGCDLSEAHGQARDARDDARAIGDPVFEAAALACGALASAVEAGSHDASGAVEEAAAALERLSPAQLATRLPAFWMLARARRSLGRLDAALADLERGAEIAAETGRENILVQLMIETAATLIELGRLREAVDAAEQGLELARLAANPPVLLWALCTLSAARLATGDVTAALRRATEADAAGTRPDFHAAGQPGWCLGAALTAAGNPGRGVAAMLESFGGDSLGAVLRPTGPPRRPISPPPSSPPDTSTRPNGRSRPARTRPRGQAVDRPRRSRARSARRSCSSGDARPRRARWRRPRARPPPARRSPRRGRSSRRAGRSPRRAGRARR